MHGLERLAGRGASRPLRGAEIDLLRPVFADAVDYAAVTVRGRGVKGPLGLRPHVVCDDVWLSHACFEADGTLTRHGRHTLLHEAGHVWQHQRGGDGYIVRALAAQLIHGARGVGSGQAYDWLAAATRGVRFEAMNPEAQAELGCWIGHAIGADGEVDREVLGALLEATPGAGAAALTEAVLDIVRGAHDALRGA